MHILRSKNYNTGDDRRRTCPACPASALGAAGLDTHSCWQFITALVFTTAAAGDDSRRTCPACPESYLETTGLEQPPMFTTAAAGYDCRHTCPASPTSAGSTDLAGHSHWHCISAQAHMPSVPRKRAGSHRSGHSRSRPGSSAAPPADLASAKSALMAAAAGPGTEEGPQAGPPAEQEGGAPEVDKGASMAVPLGRQQPRKQFTQPKPAHFSTRPMSVDDIRKQKQKEANKASILAPHHRLSAASQVDIARPPATPGNGALGRSPVGGHAGRTGPHMGFRGPMNGGKVGAPGGGIAKAGTTGSGGMGLFGRAGSLLGQQQQQQQQGRPAGVGQLPAAKRRAVGVGEGGGASMPSAPPGMVLMEELQQVSV
ncbi:hypothetical protein DUNSADRAFT_7291 [Dunaliella salina]|uniref:Encoded protein n=1 Tax=Dunaliella salina TaxID=3046 RepID=A0ABQ7GLL3_DUNSA|nr:hypothetical protein DUNSADRAFT_7291 [Dunaliella salina]|eukprot:KAF5835507.1 hypothetical protein DUNSADRAFT_7291 [Dunaliella salina]